MNFLDNFQWYPVHTIICGKKCIFQNHIKWNLNPKSQEGPAAEERSGSQATFQGTLTSRAGPRVKKARQLPQAQNESTKYSVTEIKNMLMKYFKSQNQCEKSMKNKIKIRLVLLFFPLALGSNMAPSGTASVSDQKRRVSRSECWRKEREEGTKKTWPTLPIHSVPGTTAGTFCPLW